MDKPGSHLEALDGGRQTRRLTTILVADICGYSRMSEKDQDAAIRTADLLYKLFEDVTDRHGGRVFKRIADGFLAEYPSARSGMQAALDYAKEVKARDNLAPNAINADIRAGIHVGDVTDRPDGDILGHGVNVAARLQELADPGTILASSNIMNLLGGDFKYRGLKRPRLSLKNISGPITAFQFDPLNRSIFHRFLFRKKMIRTTVAAIAGITLTVFCYSQFQAGEIDRLLLRNGLIATPLNDGGVSSYIDKDSLSEVYIRNVVENLRSSNDISDKAVYAFLKNENWIAAISELKQEEENYRNDLKNPSHIEVLKQIAALSYYPDTDQARKYFKLIHTIDPDDTSALIWKLRAENHTGNPYHAQETYRLIENRSDISSFEKLILRIDNAFSFSSKHQHIVANKILEEIEYDVIATGDERLYAHWKTGYAISDVYPQKGLSDAEKKASYDSADKLAAQVIKTLLDIGPDSNLPRAYNLRGMAARGKAKIDIENSEDHLKRAIKWFEMQNQSAKRLNKISDQIESLYSIANIDFQLGNLKLSRMQYEETLLLARKYNRFISEIRSLMGLAEILKAEGEPGLACNLIHEVEIVYQENRPDRKKPEKFASDLDSFDCA